MKTITIEIPDNLSGAVADSEDDLPRRFDWPPLSSGTARG